MIIPNKKTETFFSRFYSKNISDFSQTSTNMASSPQNEPGMFYNDDPRGDSRDGLGHYTGKLDSHFKAIDNKEVIISMKDFQMELARFELKYRSEIPRAAKISLMILAPPKERFMYAFTRWVSLKK